MNKIVKEVAKHGFISHKSTESLSEALTELTKDQPSLDADILLHMLLTTIFSQMTAINHLLASSCLAILEGAVDTGGPKGKQVHYLTDMLSIAATAVTALEPVVAMVIKEVENRKPDKGTYKAGMDAITHFHECLEPLGQVLSVMTKGEYELKRDGLPLTAAGLGILSASMGGMDPALITGALEEAKEYAGMSFKEARPGLGKIAEAVLKMEKHK